MTGVDSFSANPDSIVYQPLLANRYLGSRIIPLIAVAAVALCVALVIIVVSVVAGAGYYYHRRSQDEMRQQVRDILSERWAEDPALVQNLREWLWAEGLLRSKKVEAAARLPRPKSC